MRHISSGNSLWATACSSWKVLTPSTQRPARSAPSCTLGRKSIFPSTHHLEHPITKHLYSTRPPGVHCVPRPRTPTTVLTLRLPFQVIQHCNRAILIKTNGKLCEKRCHNTTRTGVLGLLETSIHHSYGL